VAATLRDELNLIKGLVLSASMLGSDKSEVSILSLDLKKSLFQSIFHTIVKMSATTQIQKI
jgi:hypothetical protein